MPLPLPKAKEWLIIALLLGCVLSLHVWLLHRRGMRLSTTPFIDPAGVIQVTAWDLYSARCFHEGIFPLWNSFTGVGQPHLANLQTAVFYPLKILFYPWGTLWAHDLYLFARFILLGLGIFLLLRSIGISKIGSIFSALSFSCGGYVLWFINLVELNNQLLTPFLMIALTRLASGFSWKRFLTASAIVCLDILGGHPEGIFVTLLFSSLFAIWMLGLKRLPYAIGSWVSAAATGAMASSIVLFPFVEYFTRAWNFHFAGMGFLHLGMKAPLTLLSPYFSFAVGGTLPTLPNNLSSMSLYDFFRLPYSSFQLNAGFPYLGLITSAMILTAVFNLKRLPRPAGFFIAFWVVSAGLSMGLFPFNLLGFIPPFHVTNNAKFYFAELTFSACALAGMGVELLEQREKTALMFLSFLMLLVMMFTLILGITRSHVLIQLLPSLTLVLLLFAKIFLEKRGFKLFQKTFQIMVLLLLICELAFMRQTVKPYLPLNWNKVDAQWVEEIKKEIPPAQRNFPSAFRFQAQEDFLLPPNLNLVRAIADVRSSDAMFPSKYFYWINELGGVVGDENFHDFYPRYYTRLNERGLASDRVSAIGLRYLVTEKPLTSAGIFTFKAERDGIYIYERAQACGLVYYLSEENTCETVFSIEDTREDKIMFSLEDSPKVRRKVVVINTLDYPGWVVRAKETNEEMRQDNIELPLLAFYPKEAVTKYEAQFVPMSFKLGLWLSLATILFAMFFIFGNLFFKGFPTKT